ncbi:MAG: NADH-quinone oxidoreductase subunit NuoE [Oscillospiraceae bacterium]|nr:NADH-quinone oxidoreductase subunit NuoE [Oscillospiraceae bacterium]
MCNNCAENSKYWDAFEEITADWTGDQSALIPTLQKLQDAYGYLPKDIIARLSERTGIFVSQIMGVVTFYSQFRLAPTGKHIIKICFGTACHVIGAENIADAICHELGIQLGGTTEDGLFTVESVACIGCCSLAPVIMIGTEAHGRLTPETARAVIRAFRAREVETACVN